MAAKVPASASCDVLDGGIVEPEIKTFRAVTNSFEIWCLGITVVIGGQFFCWNAGLVAGFGSFLLATVLVGLAYICLCLCTSEMSSTFPFSGGAYGFCRCSLGHYLGFVIGCCECLEYILYVSITFLSMADMFVAMAPSMEPYTLLLSFGICAASVVVYLAGEQLVRALNIFLAITSFLTLVMFCLGSLPYVDYHKNVVLESRSASSGDDGMYEGGVGTFLSILYLPTWWYVGVESLTVTAGTVNNPKVAVPVGQVSCMLTLFCCYIFVLFVFEYLDPGVQELSGSLTPFNRGILGVVLLHPQHGCD
jgi:ethanolamine permease